MTQAFHQRTATSQNAQRTPVGATFGRMYDKDVDHLSVDYHLPGDHTTEYVADSTGQEIKWSAVRKLVALSRQAKTASDAEEHMLVTHNAASRTPPPRQNLFGASPSPMVAIADLAPAIASAFSAAMQNSSLRTPIKLSILSAHDAPRPLKRMEWFREAYQALEDYPEAQQGHKATKYIESKVRTLLLAHTNDISNKGLFRRDLSMDDLRALFEQAYPGSDVHTCAIEELEALTCSSRSDWPTYNITLKTLCSLYPQSVGQRSDIDMRIHVMRNLQRIHPTMHKKMTVDLALGRDSYTSWQDLTTAIQLHLSAEATVEARLNPKPPPGPPTKTPPTPTGPTPHGQPTRHHKVGTPIKKRLYEERRHQQPRQDTRINSLQSNIDAMNAGTCAVCKATDHIASAEQCPDVQREIAGGSKWCSHCSMFNHAESQCGLLHPELNVNRNAPENRHTRHKKDTPRSDKHDTKPNRKVQFNLLQAPQLNTTKPVPTEHTRHPASAMPPGIYGMQYNPYMGAQGPSATTPVWVPPPPHYPPMLTNTAPDEATERAELYRLNLKYMTTPVQP